MASRRFVKSRLERKAQRRKRQKTIAQTLNQRTHQTTNFGHHQGHDVHSFTAVRAPRALTPFTGSETIPVYSAEATPQWRNLFLPSRLHTLGFHLDPFRGNHRRCLAGHRMNRSCRHRRLPHPKSITMNVHALLQRVLEADRALREAKDSLLDVGDTRALVRAIEQEVERAFADQDAHEAGARLICLSDLLVDIGGREAAQLLLRILGHQDPGVRVAAGEGLLELLYDRYAEVARAIEAEVDKGTNATALAEVPYILGEAGEPGGVKILTKLLGHSDPDVVGAAIEGLAMLGDSSVIKTLEPLCNDKRPITADEETEGAGEITVGDLARDAIEFLRSGKGH